MTELVVLGPAAAATAAGPAPEVARPVAGERIVWFEQLGLADRPRAGGKCASLGELISAGIPVPTGFTVTADAWQEVIEFGELYESIGSLTRTVDVGSSSALRQVQQRAVEILHAVTLPPGLESELCDAYAELCRRAGRGDVPVAVRSSAVAEDGAAASFAGQQETYLWVQGTDELVRRVRDCWASLFTPQAVAYRAKLDETQRDEATRMAVGVQEMVDAHVAGVAFTVSPTTGDPSVMAVNASWGLGEAVVSGEVTPDEFWLSKIGMAVTRSTVTHKARRCVPSPGSSGTVMQEVPAELADAPCLTGEQLRELGEIAVRVERHYGSAQDIEWALALDPDGGHRFLLLQSRPETVNQSTRATLQERSAARSAGAQAYLSVLKNLGFPGQPSGQTPGQDEGQGTR